tara:strand:- start:3480 stop:3944 length:465 start_codon:yes stop_codon:yes gene_type:complete
MATTVTAANCKITLTESYDLNGVSYGNTTSHTITGNSQVSQRIMQLAPTNESFVDTDIINLGTADSAGTVVKSQYVYFRITNLDDTNSIILTVYNGADYVYFNIKAGEFLLLLDHNIDARTSVGAVSMANIQAISGFSNHASDSVDIEFIMVTK